MDLEQIKSYFTNFSMNSLLTIVNVLLIFIIGFIIIKIVLSITKKILSKTAIDTAAQRFITTTIKFGLYLLLFMILAQVLGIPMTGFIAVVTTGSLAISLALQGSLSNLANGVVIISTKPFHEGDFVTIDGTEGTVDEIRMLHTVLKTPDNKKISIPNSTVVGSNIVNYNTNGTRKVVLKFDVSYDTDIDKAKKVIYDVAYNEEKILLEPAPFITVSALKDSSVEILTACWVNAEDYWTVYYYLMDQVFNELKRNDINIPFNQLEVRIKQEPDKNVYREEKYTPRDMSKSAVAHKKQKDSDILDDVFDSITGAKAIKKLASKTKSKKVKKQKESDSPKKETTK